MDETRTLRFTWPYRAIGILFVVLAMVFPALMAWNHERIDGAIVATFIAMAVGGLACFIYYARPRVVISSEGVEVRTALSERRFKWRDVVTVRVLPKVLRFDLSDQRHVDVTLAIPGIRELFAAAGTRLPETTWRR